MNRKHVQPNDRPVHPRCPKLLSVEFKCLCEDLWKGWDGTGKALDQRIKAEWLTEARTGWGRPGTLGTGPDADDVDDIYKVLPTAPRFVVERGYWKESEYLKTIRGDASWQNRRTGAAQQYADDKLRLYIIERGYWSDCAGAELDLLRARIAKYQRLTSKT